MDTQNDNESGYLTGKLLIATPAMADPRFHRAVIYLCTHDETQAMGLILNQPVEDLTLSELLEQMELGELNPKIEGSVMYGGPVEIERGFILHSAACFDSPTSLHVSDSVTMSTSKEILNAMTTDKPPKKVRMLLGYSGWSAGQLERELKDNAWLVTDSSDALIFKENPKLIWTRALDSLGIKPAMLSALSGNA